MDDMYCSLDVSSLLSMCCENTSIISVISNDKLSKDWDLLEEDDDHIFLKNNNNEVLFIKKGKK